MDEREFDLGYRLLDDDLIDVEGRRCGKVDDVEIAGPPDDLPHIAALLSGTGLWVDRLPGWLQGVARRVLPKPVLGRNVIRVPWSEVEDVDVVVRLRRPAAELGLGGGDDELAPVIRRLPWTR